MNLLSPYWQEETTRLIKYCARYDPTFEKTIVGASDLEIAKVEDTAGLPFPPEYKTFLSAMGQTPPRLLGQFLEYVTFGIEPINQFYNDPAVPPLPADAVYLWTYKCDTAFDIFLRTGGAELDQRPLLQFSWPFDPDTDDYLPEPPIETPVSRSLFAYLYKDAFLKIRVPVLAYHGQLREKLRPEKADERFRLRRRQTFQAIAEKLAFVPAPHVNDTLSFYDRPDAALALFSAEFAEDQLYVHAEEEHELARLCEIFIDNLDLRRID